MDLFLTIKRPFCAQVAKDRNILPFFFLTTGSAYLKVVLNLQIVKPCVLQCFFASVQTGLHRAGAPSEQLLSQAAGQWQRNVSMMLLRQFGLSHLCLWSIQVEVNSLHEANSTF